jgi:hypothetical protein
MGKMELPTFENRKPAKKNPAEEREQYLLDSAFEEGLARVRRKLERWQSESDDKFFQKLDISELTPEALMILDKSMKDFNKPFNPETKKEAVKLGMGSPLYFKVNPTPEERLDFIKELILHHPNAFYRRERGKPKNSINT